MADTSASVLKAAIKSFLEGADLSAASSKKVRAHLNEKFDCDFTPRKKEIDELVMSVLTELEDNKESSEESPEDDDDDDYSEEDEKPKKRASSGKKPTPKKKKKKGSDSDEDESEDEGSDEDYKSSKRGGGKRGGRASNGAAKPKKSGGGGGGKATGYLKKLQLSPELAEVMGEDQMARNEVVKKMYEIVKSRELLDPKNRQFAILDAQLQKVFGQKRIRMFGMMKLLGKHFSAAA